MRAAARLALVLVLLVLACGCATQAVQDGLISLPGGDTETRIFGRKSMPLLNTHLGIFEDVRECLAAVGIENSTPAWAVRWSLADSIKMQDGFWAYGLTVSWTTETPQIIIEEPFWLNPGIVSHEAIHVLSKSGGHSGSAWRCEMPTFEALPLRMWTEGVPARRERAEEVDFGDGAA